jgi:hypothetical protein
MTDKAVSEKDFDVYIGIITKDVDGEIVNELRRKMKCPDLLQFVKELDALYLKHHPDAKPREWNKVV